MSEEKVVKEFMYGNLPVKVIALDALNDYVSKKDLREWCNEIIQKEVFRKTIRFPQDKLIADTKEQMAHRILDQFCKEEK